jgi:hypothetical protein
MCLSRFCRISSDTGHCWFKASSRSARRQGLPKVGLLDTLQLCSEIWVSLNFVRSRQWLRFPLLFEHQTSHADCFNARGLLYECVFDALLFSSSYRPVEKSVSQHVVTRPTFSSFSFLDHHTVHLARHDAWILLYECIFDALWIFYIVILIYWKSASYRSSLDFSTIDKITNRSAAKLTCPFFLFWPTCMLFDLFIALRLRHDLSKVVAPTPRSGACETWVPLDPHRPGSRPSLTSGSGLPEDPTTC